MKREAAVMLIALLMMVCVGGCSGADRAQRWDVGRIGFPGEWLATKSVFSPSEHRQVTMVLETLTTPRTAERSASASARSGAVAAIRRVLGVARFGDSAASLVQYYEMKPSGTTAYYAAYRLQDELVAIRGKMQGDRVAGLRVFYARVGHPEAVDEFLKHLPADVASDKVEVELCVGPNNERERIHGVVVTWGAPVTMEEERRSRESQPPG